jgi:hypothetical protein
MSRPLTPVVAGSGLMLVTSAPVRPGLRAGWGASGCNDEDGEQAADLAAGQGNHPGGCGPVGVLGRGNHHERCVRDHRQQGPAPPRGPTADLVLVEPGQALARLEGLLDGPDAASDPAGVLPLLRPADVDVDLVAGHPPRAPSTQSAAEHPGGQRRLGQKSMSSGTPASTSRCGPVVQQRGR